MIDRIQALLAQGMSEDWLVLNMDITHLKLRTLCPTEFSTCTVTEDLAKEIVSTTPRDWPYRKIAQRYRLEEHIVARVMTGHQHFTVPEPEIDIEEVKYLISLDMTMVEMARELGMSVYNVKKLMTKLKLNVSRPHSRKLTEEQYDDIVRRVTAGDKNVDIAKDFGITSVAVSYIKEAQIGTRNKKRAVRADPALVTKLLDAGHTQAEVARQLDITQGTVSRLSRK